MVPKDTESSPLRCRILNRRHFIGLVNSGLKYRQKPFMNDLPSMEKLGRRFGPASSWVRYLLVIVLLGREESRCHHTQRINEQHRPADGAQHKRLVQLPADKKAVIVVVKIRLLFISTSTPPLTASA